MATRSRQAALSKLVKPVAAIYFNQQAPHDYADGLPHLGMQLAFGAAQYDGTGGSFAAIKDNGTGKNVLWAKTSSVGKRYDNLGQDAGIFQFTQPLANVYKTLVEKFIMRITFDQDAGIGFGVGGANVAIFCGTSDGPTAVPGTAAGAVANYAWIGQAATVHSREVNTMAAGVRTNAVSAVYYGTTANPWMQLRQLIGGAPARTHVDLDNTTLQYIVTSGSTALSLSGFGNTDPTAVHAFWGIHDIDGVGPEFKIDSIELFLWPGIVP